MLGHNFPLCLMGLCLCVVGEKEKGGKQKRKRERVSVRGGRRRGGPTVWGVEPRARVTWRSAIKSNDKAKERE